MAELIRSKIVRRNKVNVQPDSEPTVTQPIQIKSDETIRLPAATTTMPTTLLTIGAMERMDRKILEGRRLAGDGRYDEAIDVFSSISPVTFESFFYRGCARLQVGNETEIRGAIEDFNQALNFIQGQTNSHIYYKRAFACQSIGRYDQAILDYSFFIQYSSIDRQHIGYLNRGLVYADLEKHNEALTDIEHANREYGGSSKYYLYCLGQAQASVRDYDKARETFQRIADECQESSTEHDSLFYCGVALYELKDYSNALVQLNEAFKYSRHSQNRAETKFYIGLSYYASGDVESARRELKEVLGYQKNHTRTLFRLGLIESENDDSQTAALYYLTQAHELARHRPDILYERGKLHHRMGNLDAALHDKRLALQLKGSDVDFPVLKQYYDSLINHIASLMKRLNTSAPPEIHLIRGLIYEKRQSVSKEQHKWILSNRDYRQMIAFYEKALETDSDHVRVPLSLALLTTLHSRQNHVIASMIRFENFNALLDKNSELEVKWKEMLVQIKAMKEKNISQTFILQNYLQMNSIQGDGERFDEEKMKELLNLLLTEKFEDFLLLNANRDQKKADKEHFEKDGANRNRLVFYLNMQSSLAHKFTAMAATSGNSDNEPIIKHDRQGVETMIAEGLGLLGDFIGAALPTGGGVVSSAASLVSTFLKNHEYEKFQDRMALITENRDILELNELARQIARELADRYEEQLLQLDPDVQEVPCVDCSCCRKLFCCKKDQTTTKPTGEHPAKKVAQYAIAFAVQSILEEESEDINIKPDIETKELGESLVKLICSAKPNVKEKLLRRLMLDKSAILPYKSLASPNERQQAIPWHIRDFYRKPGIRVGDREEALSWMSPEIYGYRLGTVEELTDLRKLDEKEEIKKSESCCGC